MVETFFCPDRDCPSSALAFSGVSVSEASGLVDVANALAPDLEIALLLGVERMSLKVRNNRHCQIGDFAYPEVAKRALSPTGVMTNTTATEKRMDEPKDWQIVCSKCEVEESNRKVAEIGFVTVVADSEKETSLAVRQSGNVGAERRVIDLVGEWQDW